MVNENKMSILKELSDKTYDMRRQATRLDAYGTWKRREIYDTINIFLFACRLLNLTTYEDWNRW